MVDKKRIRCVDKKKRSECCKNAQRQSVCLVTGSRAEFGLLFPLIKSLNFEKKIDTRLVVTGSHLCKEFGSTIEEILNMDLKIDKRISVNLTDDSKEAMIQATGQIIEAFADWFVNHRPDLLVILGDRYEIFAVAFAASMLGIPIAHLYGGETTEGAVDEFLRHSITKMSYIHFTSCEEYRHRVIQLGESPERVFNVGAIGVENIKNVNLMDISDLQENLSFELVGKHIAIVTFHSVTLEDNTTEEQVNELICAMDIFSDIQYVITKANADAGGRIINQIWDEQATKRKNWIVVPSLGLQRYLSLLSYSSMMIGNSSSGITEAPAMHVPTVNVGDRQKGRMMAGSIINCEPKKEQIVTAMQRALEDDFISRIKDEELPFGDGHVSEKIVKEIKKFLSLDSRCIKKKFYDVDF